MRVLTMAAIGLSGLFLVPAAGAAPPRRDRHSRAIMCPDQCGMRMSTRRDRAHPVRTEFQGRTLYCCNWCGFSRAARALRSRRVRTVACPDRCGMTMSTHRDRTHPVRVRIQGRTLYCCNWCSFSKSAQRLRSRR